MKIKKTNMNEVLASIIITSFNKGKFIKKTIKSALNQNYRKKEIIVFDDKSTDNSINIIKNFKKIKIITNKNKKKKSGPLNQINATLTSFKKSKGKYIFFLDGDDQFKKNKLKTFMKIFENNKKINFLHDKPYLFNEKRKLDLKKKLHFFSIWPSVYPTSCIAIKKSYLIDFLKVLNKNNYPNLEIDARLFIFAYLNKDLRNINETYTIYKKDYYGISSNYKKFSIKWWKKRYEGFEFMENVATKLNHKFLKGPDYFLTKLLNQFF